MLFDDDPCSSERSIKIRVAFAPNGKVSGRAHARSAELICWQKIVSEFFFLHSNVQVRDMLFSTGLQFLNGL